MKKVLLIIILAAATRIALAHFTEHPGILTPIIGMAIFSGYYLKKWWASLMVMGAMFMSDWVLGLYNWKLMVSVYGSILAIYLVSRVSKKFILTSLFASLIYFVITNFAVWEFTNWYPHTQEGLMFCYTMAIPYLKVKIINDMGFTTAFFGVYALAKALERKLVCAFA